MADSAELKASLGEYLARVKAGEEVVVTEDGHPVARLVPVKSAEEVECERLREMERRGESSPRSTAAYAMPPRRKGSPYPRFPQTET